MDLKSPPKIYNYLDGNGNQFIIKKDIIEYIPVKPQHSSSGVYNVGNYTKKELSNIQYNQLTSILNVAIKNKKIHIKNRVKMSGMIIIQEKNKENVCILSPNSKEVQEIDSLLHDTISN